MNRLTGYQLEFVPIDGLAKPTEIEITVYRCVHSITHDEAGQTCESKHNEPTELRLNNACIARILAIPNLREISVHDSPAYCADFILSEPVKNDPQDFWFVHYRDYDDLRLWAGTVIILRRDTGEVVYQGTAGGD